MLDVLGSPRTWLEPCSPKNNHPNPSTQLCAHEPCPWQFDLLGASVGKKLSQGNLLNMPMGLKAFSFEKYFSWAPEEMEAAPKRL